MRNPINLNTSIDLLPTINNLQPAYGRFADSGLFREYGIKTNAVIYSVEQQENTRMTKLTSRTERDAVKVSRGRSKQVTAAAETIKLTGGVHVEDLQNRLNKFDIDTDETVLPSMLIQPFAENAIKHAFQTDSEENMLSISFSKSGNTLHIEVADNGIGINQTAQQEKNHQSMASEIFEQRMKILGRKWKNKTYFSVHDLSESGSRGTRVVFGIPLFKLNY